MCWHKRSPAARILAVTSTIICLMSIGILALTVRFFKSDLFSTEGALKDVSSLIFYVFFGFSLVAIITAMFGMIAAKVSHRAPVIIYGIVMTLIWIVFLGAGFIVAMTSYVGEPTLDAFCKGELDESNPLATSLGDTFRDYIQGIDDFVSTTVSSNMCRDKVCPCPEAYARNWTKQEDDYLALYGRSKEDSATTLIELSFVPITLPFVNGKPNEDF